MVACHRRWLIFIIPWKLHAATRVATCGREKRQPSARTWHAFYFNSIFSTLTDCDFSPATWYVRALFSSPPHPRKRISQIATAGVAVFEFVSTIVGTTLVLCGCDSLLGCNRLISNKFVVAFKPKHMRHVLINSLSLYPQSDYRWLLLVNIFCNCT